MNVFIPQNRDIWFTSDLHLFHKRLLQYRPFDSVKEMNEALLENWNSCIKKKERIYCLGDFSLGPIEATSEIIKKLNGTIYMIRGNHDNVVETLHKRYEPFVWLKDIHYLETGAAKIMLCHYPMLTWRASGRGSWNLHGHCHGALPDELQDKCYRMDVGVDCWNFKPVHLEEIAKVMKTRKVKLTNHHDKDHYA